MADLGDMFEQLEADSGGKSRDEIIKPPFGWPGGKSRSLTHILPHLPYTGRFVEGFGGSGAVLLARSPSKLEVYNDRYGGVTDFYKCLKNPVLMDQLCNWLEVTVHSREAFVEARDTWQDYSDPVERAARWFFMIRTSFGSLGRNWGRATSPGTNIAQQLKKKIKEFPDIQQRLAAVQVENQDWHDCVNDYDNHDTVFYFDPPYVDAYAGTYKHGMSKEEYRDFVHRIRELKGFVALSGYPNPFLDKMEWDHRVEWEVFVSIKSMAYTDNNHKKNLEGQESRSHASEVLWIKDAS